jgi:hypothetical protein
VYLQIILPITLAIAFLAACFAGLFWRLASRFDPSEDTAAWLDRFSLESYAPMTRLLEKQDLEFLASQPGYHPKIAKRLMAERRAIFAGYLSHLIRDFSQLAAIGRLMIVYSNEDRQEFARRLWRQQVQFYAAVCSVRLQLALCRLGWQGTDSEALVAAVAGLREQVLSLTSRQPGRIAGAAFG